MADRFVLGVAPVDYGPVSLLKPFRFHLTMDTLSSGCLATECELRHPLDCLLRFRLCARLGFSLFALPGQRGVTPAFGYSTPHPGARGTLTLLISALPSAHCGPLRHLTWPDSVPRRTSVGGHAPPPTRLPVLRSIPLCMRATAQHPGGTLRCICHSLPAEQRPSPH